MSYELPPKTRGTVLLGSYGGTILPIAVDDLAQLYALLRGAKEGGGVGTVLLDDSGRMMVIIKGAGGQTALVDSNGNLSAQMRGRGLGSKYGDNLIVNGDFEDNGSGGADVFAGWNEVVGDGAISAETVLLYEGSQSAKLTSGATFQTYLHQTFVTVGGSTVLFRVRGAALGGWAGNYAIYDVTNGAYLVTWTTTGLSHNYFGTLERSVDIPATCVSVRLYLTCPPHDGATVYYDDVSCRRLLAAMGDNALGYPLSVDEEGQIIMVPRGQNGNYMDVDSSGYISAVLKAAYGSALTTVGCDAAGRLKFFLTDNVDLWGEYLEVGNAELAARLVRLPVSMDRRGQILFYDDFEDGQGAWQFVTGGAGAGAMQTTGWLQGGKCVKLDTGAAGADSALTRIWIPPPPASLGLGLALYFAVSALPDYLEMILNYGNGTTMYNADVILDSTTGQIWANTVALGYTQVGTWDKTMVGLKYWHYLKLSFDHLTGKYIRLLYNGQSIDLSAHSVPNGASGNHALWPDFYMQGWATAAATAYVDCVALTTKEC